MSKRWRVRVSVGSVLLGAICVAALAFSALASAQVTVGQLAPTPGTKHNCEFPEPYDELQASVAAGNSYVVPASGVLTSWSTLANTEPTGQVLGLKIFRRIGAGAYFVVGQDVRPLTPGVLNTFPVSVPVAAGDILGTTIPAGTKASCFFATENAGDVIAFAKGNVAPGGTAIFQEPFTAEAADTTTEVRLDISATLLPPPVVTAISPATGAIAGAPVVIAGANFADVTGVAFGGVPVAFAVDSEAQITATAPPSATLAAVPVTVTTVAGAATAAQVFTYEGCSVPKLKGKRLKVDRKSARSHDCKIGKVTKEHGATAKTGKVVGQKPAPGKILATGTPINVKLK